MTSRHVLLVVAPPRRPWTTEVARWATSGVLPVDAVSCLSVDEVRAVLGSGRSVSAVLADAGTAGLDRDVVADATTAGVPVLVIDDGRTRRDWEAIGCAELLQPAPTVEVLADALGRHARAVDPNVRRTARVSSFTPASATHGQVVGVTGTDPGAGALVACALAQGLAAGGGPVALVDGCRRSPLTVLHDPGTLVPGLPELVDACRADAPDPDDVRRLLRTVDTRRYDLLLGLRRSREWTLLRPRAVQAALDALVRTYRSVVVHHDPDLDDDPGTGSIDVEERHALSLATSRTAAAVVVAERAGVAGSQAASTVRADLLDAGVEPTRLVTVLLAPRTGPALRRSMHGVPPAHGQLLVLAEPRATESMHRAVAQFPHRTARSLAAAVRSAGEDSGPTPTMAPAHRVRPQELGTRLDGEVA